MFEDVRSRVREQLQARKVDAYLAYTPSNLFYTTGFLSPVVALSWRLMGTDMALIPADSASPPALITSDFVEAPARAATTIQDIRTYRMWVENRDIDVISGAASEANLESEGVQAVKEIDIGIGVVHAHVLQTADRCLQSEAEAGTVDVSVVVVVGGVVEAASHRQ